MAKRPAEKTTTTEHLQVGKHKIEYRKIGEHEEVLIDGKVTPFFRVGKQYQLEFAAYEAPCDSLLEATQTYAKKYLA